MKNGSLNSVKNPAAASESALPSPFNKFTSEPKATASIVGLAYARYR